MGTSAKRAAAVHLCGLAGAAAWVSLAILTRRDEPLPLGVYWCLVGWAWLMTIGAWLAARGGVDPPRRLVAAIWCWAILWRGIGLWGQPVYEDDWSRYLWDGRQLVETGNPYQVPPMAAFGDRTLGPEWRAVLDGINHPDIPTVYPPVCQAAFAISYSIAPAQLWPLKLLLIASELATLWLLGLLVGKKEHLLFYAWCPLLIQETAFTAHPEAVWVMAIAGALVARSRGRMKIAALCCGLAIAGKILALLIVPFILWDGKWRASAGRMVAAFFVTALCYAPFWLQGSTADIEGLRAMAGDWEFNATVFKWLSLAMAPWLAKALCATVFAALWISLWWRWRRAAIDDIPRGDIIYGLFFLFGTVVNPWYMAVLAAFVSLRPAVWSITALVAVTLSYAHGLNMMRPDLAPYELAGWVRPLEIALVLIGYFIGRTGAGRGAG